MDGDPLYSRRRFRILGLALTAQFLGAVIIILLVVKFDVLGGGISWSTDAPEQRTTHPLCMVLGMVFLYGNSLLVHHKLSHSPNVLLKLLYVGLLLLALSCGIFGQVTIFLTKNHQKPPSHHMASLHAWLGMIVMLLFISQMLAGAVFFFLPLVPRRIHQWHDTIYMYLGFPIFIGAIMTCLSYISHGGSSAKQLVVCNFLGITLIGFGLVICLTTQLNQVHQEREEEEAMLLEN